jgi:hypothetical protein
MGTVAYLIQRLRSFRDELRKRCALVHLPQFSSHASATATFTSPLDPRASLLARIRAYRPPQGYSHDAEPAEFRESSRAVLYVIVLIASAIVVLLAVVVGVAFNISAWTVVVAGVMPLAIHLFISQMNRHWTARQPSRPEPRRAI